MENSLAFFLVAVNTSLVTVGLSKSATVAIYLLLIFPSCTLYNAMFFDILTCPCLQSPEFKTNHRRFVLILQKIGLLIAFPLMILGLVLLVLAAMFTSSPSKVGILVTYVIQVQVYGAGMQYHRFSASSSFWF